MDLVHRRLAAREATGPRGTVCYVVPRVPRQHLSFRVPEPTLARLESRAHEIRETRTALAERYLEEGLRMDEHPGISFVDGPAGRRATVLGTGLDVWEVIGAVKAARGSATSAGRYLELSPAQIRVAIRYYGSFTDEVDEWLARQEAAAEREREAAQRERVLLR
jgi:uncharacterized protein (DUF433 family)